MEADKLKKQRAKLGKAPENKRDRRVLTDRIKLLVKDRKEAESSKPAEIAAIVQTAQDAME